MRIYGKNYRAEKKLGRCIKYKYKRFKIGFIFCAVFLAVIMTRCLSLISGAGDTLYEEDFFMVLVLMFGYNIFPIIGLLISYWTAISGGRDILLTRRNEQIVFMDEEFKIQYSPIFRKVEDYDYIEKTIPFHKIQSMVYDKKFQRLEITTDYTCKRWYQLSFGDSPSNVTTSNYQESEIKIYNCFENMQDFMERLSMACGKQIQMK